MAGRLDLIIESLLFSTDRPLSHSDICELLPENTKDDINAAIISLRDYYDSLERSFALTEVATGFQFRTKPEYGQYLVKMLKTSGSRLSQAAMETLAVIAYQQPIMRHEIERLRGVDSGGIIRTLLDKGLVRIMGRKNLPGRPLIYGTTKKFLEVFGLKEIESLPKLKEIKDFGGNAEKGYQITKTRQKADEFSFVGAKIQNSTGKESEGKQENSETSGQQNQYNQ